MAGGGRKKAFVRAGQQAPALFGQQPVACRHCRFKHVKADHIVLPDSGPVTEGDEGPVPADRHGQQARGRIIAKGPGPGRIGRGRDRALPELQADLFVGQAAVPQLHVHRLAEEHGRAVLMEHLGLQGLPRGLQGGVQFDLLHLLPDLLEEQEVDLVVGGQRQRAPADVDFRPQEHPCVQPAAVQHSGAIRLGGATMIGIGVDVDHLLAVLPEQFAQTARQRIGPEDHPAHLAGAAHTEQSGDKPATQAGAHHGDGDHQKHQGAQFQAPGQPLVRERGGEKGGHGRGHNAPRTDPGDEQPFPPGERGTPGAGENRCRPDQHHQGEHHEQPGQTEIRDLVDAHIRGQEDKEHADQQYGQLLLELHQVAQHIGAIVADDQAGHGHGDDAALRHQGVGGLEQG